MKKGVRPPQKNKVKNSSPPVPIISIADEEKKLLIELSKNKTISINRYSDLRKIPRSTTRSRLKKLDRIGLISYKPTHHLNIVEKGLIYLEQKLLKNNGDESLRLGGRENDLSVHWHKFNVLIKNKEKFRKEKLNHLNCTWTENKGMNNWSETIAKFNDATIIIKPNTLVISLFDTIKKDADEVDAICLRRLIEYLELFDDLGLETERVTIERGHWARIDSELAKWIEKKFGNGYELRLNGEKIFYVDFSPDKYGIRHLEDETPSKEFRSNIDNALLNIGTGKIDLTDIKALKESLALITSMESLRLQEKIEENKLKRLQLEKFDNELKSGYSGYFG